MDEHVPRLPMACQPPFPFCVMNLARTVCLVNMQYCLRQWPTSQWLSLFRSKVNEFKLKYRTYFANDLFRLPVYCGFNSWPSIPCIRWIYQAGIIWHFWALTHAPRTFHEIKTAWYSMCVMMFWLSFCVSVQSRASFGILEALVSHWSSSFAWQRIHVERKKDWQQEETWRDGARSRRGWTDQIR